MKIRIGHLSTFYHTSILMIATHTLMNKVTWKLFGTGPAIVDAFEKGELDIAYIGLPPAIIGMDRGVQIKCIAGGHINGTVISGRKEAKGFPETSTLVDVFAQLTGEKIGVPGKGSIHDVILSQYLGQYDPGRRIEVVNFRWADLIIEAMVKKNVSAAIGTPALAVGVQRYADGKILYPASRLWPDNPSYGIVVHKDFMEKQGDIVEEFLIEHENGTEFLRNNPMEAARIISDYVSIIDKDFIMDVLKVSPAYCAHITNEYVSATMEFVQALWNLGYIKKRFSSEDIFDTSLIRKIHPSKDHYRDGLSAP